MCGEATGLTATTTAATTSRETAGIGNTTAAEEKGGTGNFAVMVPARKRRRERVGEMPVEGRARSQTVRAVEVARAVVGVERSERSRPAKARGVICLLAVECVMHGRLPEKLPCGNKRRGRGLGKQHENRS